MGELTTLKGVGKVMESKLKLEKIDSIQALVETLPVKYVQKKISDFAEAKLNEEITLSGICHTLPVVAYIRKRLTKLSFQMRVGHTLFTVSIFNREFLRSNLQIDTEVVVTGKFTQSFHQMIASEIVLKKNFQIGIIPVYRLERLGSKQFQNIVQAALPRYIETLTETIPHDLLAKNRLVTKKMLYSIVHTPKTEQEVERATRRMIYEELLDFALRVEAYKKLSNRIIKDAKIYDIERIRAFIRQLPFDLTADQKQATNDIFRDLKSKKPMNRLLQGDVGCGKTICAVITALAVSSAGEQVAYMAPTEILAVQHHQTFSDYFQNLGIKTAFLSSSVALLKRKEILEALKQGEIDILIGTHSLIQDDLVFHKLGLVIIDEQHRFGVTQRKILREKGVTPDVLFMSATPIPRTLAITMFGDMDISSIRTIPSGRKPIQTQILDFEQLDSVYPEVLNELNQGHQAYFIVPLIDEKSDSILVSVSEYAKELRGIIPKNFRIGLMHGQMPNEEKTLVLEQFYRNEIAVLVSTTVVEVGLNVPNATVMTVLNANRFGLTQLHQLRGRVGRSKDQAKCFLIIPPDLEVAQRLSILEKSNDGFEISEADLLNRGPGELFGEEQTGIPKFKIANLVRDEELLNLAIIDAKSIMVSDDLLAKKLVRQTFRMIDSYILD